MNIGDVLKIMGNKITSVEICDKSGWKATYNRNFLPNSVVAQIRNKSVIRMGIHTFLIKRYDFPPIEERRVYVFTDMTDAESEDITLRQLFELIDFNINKKWEDFKRLVLIGEGDFEITIHKNDKLSDAVLDSVVTDINIGNDTCSIHLQYKVWEREIK